jgi:hypothetical protein
MIDQALLDLHKEFCKHYPVTGDPIATTSIDDKNKKIVVYLTRDAYIPSKFGGIKVEVKYSGKISKQ